MGSRPPSSLLALRGLVDARASPVALVCRRGNGGPAPRPQPPLVAHGVGPPASDVFTALHEPRYPRDLQCDPRWLDHVRPGSADRRAFGICLAGPGGVRVKTLRFLALLAFLCTRSPRRRWSSFHTIRRNLWPSKSRINGICLTSVSSLFGRPPRNSGREFPQFPRPCRSRSARPATRASSAIAR